MSLRPPLAAALVILAVLGACRTRSPVLPLTGYDQPFYLGIAGDLLHQHRFTDGPSFAEAADGSGRPSGMRFAPLYPALLAAAALVDPPFRRALDCSAANPAPGACRSDATAMRTLQFLLLAGTFWMLWRAAGRCGGRGCTGWLALGIGLATAPTLLRSANTLMTEIVGLFLFVLASTLLLEARARSGSAGAADRLRFGAGLAIGLAVLARPAYGSLAALLLGGGLPWAVLGGRGGGRRWRAVGVPAAGGGLVLLPWIVRNVLVMHRAALTFGYASHTLVQRLAFDRMGWRDAGVSALCWTPDGTGLGRALFGAGACDRFGLDAPSGYYAIGLGPMLAQSLRQAGGWDRHMGFLWRTYLLHDPLRQLGWHAMVTLPLALRGACLDHYWGLLLAPVCLAVTVRAALRRREADRRFLMLALPAWFMLAFCAAVAVDQVRYNLALVLPFSVSGALAIEALAARLQSSRIGYSDSTSRIAMVMLKARTRDGRSSTRRTATPHPAQSATQGMPTSASTTAITSTLRAWPSRGA